MVLVINRFFLSDRFYGMIFSANIFLPIEKMFFLLYISKIQYGENQQKKFHSVSICFFFGCLSVCQAGDPTGSISTGKE